MLAILLLSLSSLAVSIAGYYFTERRIMATTQELLDAVAGVVSSTSAEIQRITDEITTLQAAGNDGVTPADLDAPVASLTQVKAALDGVVFPPPTTTPPAAGA